MPKKQQPVRVGQLCPAPPEAVFDAWITPATVRRWLFVSPQSSIVGLELDARVGGPFSIRERGPDGDIDHWGIYLEIDRPKRLVFTLEVPRHFPGVTRVAIDISPAAGGAELTLTQTGVAPEVVQENWRTMLSALADLLAETRKA